MESKDSKLADASANWSKSPEFLQAYNTLKDQLALASAFIGARTQANMTQDDVAKAMGTTRNVVTRLESGRFIPSTRFMKRFADATGTKLRFHFEEQRSKPPTS